MQSGNCNRKGHTARFCRAPTQSLNQVPDIGVNLACYECGEIADFKRNCPKARNVGDEGRVLMITTGELYINERYAP